MRPEQAQYNRIKEASQKLTIKRILFMYTPQSISIIHKYCEKKYDRYSNLNTEINLADINSYNDIIRVGDGESNFGIIRKFFQ